MEKNVESTEKYRKHDLQFYEEPFHGSMHFNDLLKLVEDRLSILKIVMEVADMNLRGSANICRRQLIVKLREKGFRSFADLCKGTGYVEVPTEERYMARSKDHVSHSILLISISQIDDDSREWFREAEEHLFKWRLSALDDRGIDSFMTINNLRYPELTTDEKNLLRDSLKRELKHKSLFESTKFYKVQALEILEGLMERNLYLKGGIAYPSHNQLRHAFVFAFNTRLRSRIQKFKEMIHYQVDPRIQEIIRLVPQWYKKIKRRTWDCGVVTIENLKELAGQSFPPCARKLYEAFCHRHHLRYEGRFQLTLFLKLIDLSCSDAIEFFKEEFLKEIDEKKFNREYLYNIRHTYGQVGSKIQFPVPLCTDIADKKPRTDEYHGCPFATNDIEELGNILTNWNINNSAKNEIINLSKKGKCTEACGKYFTATHWREPIAPIRSPVDFYGQSVNLRNGPKSDSSVSSDDSDDSDDSVDSDDSESSYDFDQAGPYDAQKNGADGPVTGNNNFPFAVSAGDFESESSEGSDACDDSDADGSCGPVAENNNLPLAAQNEKELTRDKNSIVPAIPNVANEPPNLELSNKAIKNRILTFYYSSDSDDESNKHPIVSATSSTANESLNVYLSDEAIKNRILAFCYSSDSDGESKKH